MQTLIQRFLNQIHDSSFTTLFTDASVKSVLILAFAALVILCLRRASAGTRHLVWFLGLLSLLFLPLLSWIVPAWHKPLWAMKTSPTSGNEVLVLAPKDTTLQVLSRRGEWVQVGLSPELRKTGMVMRWYKNENNGWIHDSMVEVLMPAGRRFDSGARSRETRRLFP